MRKLALTPTRLPDGQSIEIFQHFLATARVLQRAITQITERHGLSDTQFFILWACGQSPESGLSQTQLAKSLTLSPGQVSHLVEQLRHQGLLESCRCQLDRRKQIWQATEAGHLSLQRILSELENLPCCGDSCETPMDLSGFKLQLNMLREQISHSPRTPRIHVPEAPTNSPHGMK